MGAIGGAFSFVLVLTEFVSIELARTATSIWLWYWTKQQDKLDASPAEGSRGQGPSKGTGGGQSSASFFIGVYAAISALQVLLTLVNRFDLARLGVRAARRLHEQMLRALLRAPMRFFHQTPSGRIINRCSKDTTDVDRNLTGFLAFFLTSLLQLIATLALIGVVAPFSLPVLVPLMLLFYFLYVIFQSNAREIKRLDALSRTPLYSAIGNTIAGLATIRAYRAEEQQLSATRQLLERNLVLSLIA